MRNDRTKLIFIKFSSDYLVDQKNQSRETTLCLRTLKIVGNAHDSLMTTNALKNLKGMMGVESICMFYKCSTQKIPMFSLTFT